MNKVVADPLVGKVVGQYEIVAKLGGGGMGVVYTARDTKLGRLVALKFLPPQWSHDEGAKQRFIREAQAASATDHRNICTIHNIESAEDGRLFIVMAHYAGQTLKEKLDAGPLAVDEAVEIAAQVAEGLAKAHAQGVVHRDIKPGNLMITDDGVRILDFGLAKFADSLHLTIAGSTLGTVAYMSPEQARGEEADIRSDVWSLGVVLYQMLAGAVPFKGAYPEAISYAIRNDPPPSLSATRQDVPPEVERLVLHALTKDPAERIQSAREMARDLRLLQGRTVPIDLRTEALPPLAGAGLPPRSRRVRNAIVAAAVVLAAVAGVSLWVVSPVARIPIAIAPVANQTGYPELDAYRLALTQHLVGELRESPNVRVLSYERLLQSLRRFLASGTDVSSREALQALTSRSPAQLVVVPTLVQENGAWRARAEIRSAETATNVAVYETDPVVSSLVKDTAYGLMASLASGVQRHFADSGPMNLRVRARIRALAGNGPPPATSRLGSLDAAATFEQGVRAYETLEFESARRFFARAAEQDPRSALAPAWLARVSLLLRQNTAAGQAADQASRLVTPETPDLDRRYIAAVSAESRRDFAAAADQYRELTERHPDEPGWFTELAGFQDRRAETANAITTYRDALKLDDGLARPHLELCRLYNRLNEPASAKAEGDAALSAYRSLGDQSGEAQALMCLTDMLRLGSDVQRIEARRHAEAAVTIFEALGYGYNLARAQYYIALATEAQGHWADAAAAYEQSLATARLSGNVVLEPLDLMNLGATYEILGSHSRAIDHYQQSQNLFQKLGDDQRAAQIQANIAAILIEYGGRPEEGLRNLQNALAVFRKLGDKNWEVFAAKVTAASHRSAGRHEDAERELNRAIALAKERNMDREIPALTIDLGLSRFEMSDYAGAEILLRRALEGGSGKSNASARIHLGLVHVRLGQFEAAQTEFDQAARDMETRQDTGFLPVLLSAMGTLAYESGRRAEARAHFGKAAALWTDDLPDPASVEARASLGLLDALEGAPARARAAVQSSLDQARKTGPFSLEARCRVYLARIEVGQKRSDEALSVLNTITPEREQALGAELRAQVHYWRGQALSGRGDAAGSRSEDSTARQLAQQLRAAVPEPYRSSFSARPDIRVMIE